MIIKKPQPNDYPSFYETYIKLIKKEDIIDLLENQQTAFYAFIKSISEDKENYKYAEEKWTLKEVIGHVIDVERVMAYRSLAISRGDKQPLPGMDENTYISNGNYSERSLKALAEEFLHIRTANIYLFRSFSEKMVTEQGIANGNPITVAALVYIIAGHLEHHVHVIKERYM